MAEIPRPKALRDVGLVLVVLTKLLDTSVSVWALERVHPIHERNAVAADVYAAHGPVGMLVLTAVALALLIVVVELGGKYIKRKTHGEERRRNLQAIYGIGYWLPGVLWLWVGLYNGWLVLTLIRAGHPLVI